MEYYAMVFAVAMVITAASVAFAKNLNSGSKIGTSPSFKSFQSQYLMVYFLMMAGDWLQGPYVYALYSSYGFSQEEIAVLFVVGFGSSMFFGTFIGSLADRLGRKRFCLLYIVLYIMSCLTKHFKVFSVLLVGRLLGGVATSLLFSVFDAWMVSEHNRRGYDGEWLSETFSSASFGNSVVAILAGVVAQAAADMKPLTPVTEDGLVMMGGFCTPFDLAITALTIGAFILSSTWGENYGMSDDDDSSSIETGAGKEAAAVAGKNNQITIQNLIDMNGLKQGLRLLRNDSAILLCGCLQSLFESSMYIFVFMWTPAMSGGSGGHRRLLVEEASNSSELEAASEELPYGRMFATFMLCCMSGSSMFSVLSKMYSPDGLLLRIFLVSSLALAVPCWTESTHACYMAFLVFEVCVGIYFPAMGTMKSSIVPEESRAALYNLFRVPLNFIVVGVLLSDMSTTVAFGWSASLLGVGTVLQFVLMRRLSNKKQQESAGKSVSSLDDLLKSGNKDSN